MVTSKKDRDLIAADSLPSIALSPARRSRFGKLEYAKLIFGLLPAAASRRPGLSRNWTLALTTTVRRLLQAGQSSSSTARAKGAIGRHDFHVPQQQRQKRCYFVLSAGAEPECAARGLNNRAARSFVWIIHKLVEPNL